MSGKIKEVMVVRRFDSLDTAALKLLRHACDKAIININEVLLEFGYWPLVPLRVR